MPWDSVDRWRDEDGWYPESEMRKKERVSAQELQTALDRARIDDTTVPDRVAKLNKEDSDAI